MGRHSFSWVTLILNKNTKTSSEQSFFIADDIWELIKLRNVLSGMVMAREMSIMRDQVQGAMWTNW